MTHYDFMTAWPIGVRIVIAYVVGGVIGFEREMHGRPAGLRTHMLVCVGAALISAVDTLIPSSGGKITAQIVTGVGFLGAGTILRGGDNSSVHGLTTAASLWCVAGIGIALGSGGLSVYLALTVALLVLLALTFVEKIERFAMHRLRYDRELVVYLGSDGKDAAETASSRLLDDLIASGVIVRGVRTEQLDASPLSKVVHIKLDLSADATPEAISKKLSNNTTVNQFNWER
jgi:putative Mg2+ transporter-C (MgtC) family protein